MKAEETVEQVLKDGFGFYKKQFAASILVTIIAILGSIFIITAQPRSFGADYMGLKII